MASLTKQDLMTEHENLRQSLSEYKTHIKSIENNYINRITIAENTISKIRSSFIQLEILVSGVLKLYCTEAIKERQRIDYIF